MSDPPSSGVCQLTVTDVPLRDNVTPTLPGTVAVGGGADIVTVTLAFGLNKLSPFLACTLSVYVPARVTVSTQVVPVIPPRVLPLDSVTV